jgi:CheY-like chemotaxis protein
MSDAMTKKALIVEDDPQVLEYIENTLCSLNHEHVWVTNQQDARQRFQDERFDYVLLDLQIPAKPNRGGASKQFGINLLREILGTPPRHDLPVIIMTAYTADGLNLSNELRSYGAADFIAKPLESSGRSLARVIEQALESIAPFNSPEKEPQLKPFQGGPLVFSDRRVELHGVKIISRRGNARSIAVLQTLACKDACGRFIRMSADELARAVGDLAGANTITASIQTLRSNATVRLRDAGVACGPEDLIAHSEQGYYLQDWITIHDADDGNVPADGPADDSTDNPADHVLNRRQEWILNELLNGAQIRRVHVERQLGVTEKTAKRDLTELVARGMIVYVRQGRDGYYRIHQGEQSVGRRTTARAGVR